MLNVIMDNIKNENPKPQAEVQHNTQPMGHILLCAGVKQFMFPFGQFSQTFWTV